MGKQGNKTPAVTLVGDTAEPHDRRSTDLPINSVVAAAVVDDPFEAGAKLTVLRSLRDDPLAAMWNARQIDEAQFTAGRHWQRAFEVAGGAGCKAIDPTKEAVDGGQIARATITERQATAFQDLRRATTALGLEGESLVRHILGHGITVAQAAARRGFTGERERRYIGQRFRECLNTLAVEFGYAGRAAKVSA